MSKFNQATTRPAVTSPIVSERIASGTTHEGAPGFARDAKSELFTLAVANMVSEQTAYEAADVRDERFDRLIRTVTGADPEWTAGFLKWLRGEGNMRSASLVGAASFVAERILLDRPGMSRQVVDSVLQRADEPGEFLAHWTSTYGRTLPKPVKRGVADALQRLYTERNLLKYDTASKGYRFGDVIELVHPSPAADKPWQGELFQFAIERRRDRVSAKVDSSRLHTVIANSALRLDASEDPSVLLDADRLGRAGMTWEDALSLAGNRVDKARLWEAMIPSMGIMALARNLRNFDEAGVSDSVAATVSARFADAEQVAKSRMFPFRWLAAYRHAPSLRWGHALDQALTASLANVPVMSGRTLILVDISGSMDSSAGGKMSDMKRSDVAGVFGAAIAMRTDPTLVWFHTSSGRVDVPKGGSLLKLVESIPRPGGGTYTSAAVQRWYAGHDRVIVITDEQSHDGGGSQFVPANIPMYVWNVAGYQHGQMASGTGNRHVFAGLNDAGFRMVPLLENRAAGTWPWLAQG